MATAENILNMIEITFHMEGRPLVGTEAEKAYQTYLTDKDLKAYKDSLEKYRDSLVEDNEMLVYNSVNRLFQMVNSIFLANQTGDSTLTSLTLAGLTVDASDNLSDQSITLNRLLQSTIGTDAINKTGFLGVTEAVPGSLVVHANQVSSTIGNKAPAAFTLTGFTTAAFASLSTHLMGFISATETAVGKDALSKTGFLGVTEAVPGSLVVHANQVTSTIGNKAPAAFTLAGITTAAFTSLSTHLMGFISAVETALGNSKIAPETARTVKSCTYSLIKKSGYTIGGEIYTTSKDVTKTMVNLLACGKWIDDTLEAGNNLYFSHTGFVGDCSSKLDAAEAMAKCLKYLHPD
jgi:hypothetical protein